LATKEGREYYDGSLLVERFEIWKWEVSAAGGVRMVKEGSDRTGNERREIKLQPNIKSSTSHPRKRTREINSIPQDFLLKMHPSFSESTPTPSPKSNQFQLLTVCARQQLLRVECRIPVCDVSKDQPFKEQIKNSKAQPLA